MGSALGRIGAFNMNQLGLNLGMQDQMARERAMQQMMGINTQLSGLQQRDVAQDINYRIMLEQNYGLAKQQGIRDVMGAVTGFGTAALSSYNAAQDREMYKQLYGTGGNKVAGLSDLPYGSSTESGAFGLRVPQGMGVPKTPTVFGLRTTRNT
jgi:pyrroline-5-carboxylate reductase